MWQSAEERVHGGSRRNRPQLSTRHEDDDDDDVLFKLKHMLSVTNCYTWHIDVLTAAVVYDIVCLALG